VAGFPPLSQQGSEACWSPDQWAFIFLKNSKGDNEALVTSKEFSFMC